MKNQFDGTIISHMLCNAQLTLTILSNNTGPPFFLRVYSVGRGVVALRFLYLCRTAPITRSTWILTLASFLVNSTSLAVSCDWPLVKLVY